MKKRTKHIKLIYELVFFLTYGVVMAAGLFNRTFLASFFLNKYAYILAGSWLLLGMMELVLMVAGEYNINDWLFAFICGCLFLILLRNIGDSIEFATVIPFIYVGRKIDFRKIAKVTLLVQGSIILFVVVSALMGIISNIGILPYDEMGGLLEDGRPMFYLGFLFHLFLGNLVLNFTFLVIYLKNKDIEIYQLILLLFINIVVYLGTNGRLAFGLAVAIIMISWINHIEQNAILTKIYNKVKNILLMIFPIGFITSLLACIFYNQDKKWMKRMDVFLGSRLSMSHDGLKNFGLTLWGKHVNMYGSGLTVDGWDRSGEYNWVDNTWMNMAFRYGVVLAVVFCLLYTGIMFYAKKKKEYYLILILILLSFQMLIDDCNMLFYFNTFLLLMGKAFAFDKMSEFDNQTKE